jgi:hypothetical protein
MPSGYTCKIKDGQSFNDFVMGCARAMGVCVTMRDDPADTPIPEVFKPSDYHVKAVESAIQAAAKFKTMSDEDAELQATKAYNDACEQRKESLLDNANTIQSYVDMLKKVDAWEPPTEEHKQFKEFMQTQIKQSMEFDDMSDYYANHPCKQMSGQEWRDTQLANAKRDMSYHAEEADKEAELCKGRTAWIQRLRESLEVA